MALPDQSDPTDARHLIPCLTPESPRNLTACRLTLHKAETATGCTDPVP